MKIEITSEMALLFGPVTPYVLICDGPYSEILARKEQVDRLIDLFGLLHAYLLPEEGGLLSDYGRHLKIRLHPTDEELVEIWDGQEWKRGPLFEDWYFRSLRREEFRRFLSALEASRRPAHVVAENDNGYLPGCVFECKTCGQQSPTLEALRGCHGSILVKLRRVTGGRRSWTKSLPAKARPGCLPCDPAETVCPSDHVSRGELDGLAHAKPAIDIPEEGEMCVPPARPHCSHGLTGNTFGEGTSTMHNPVSPRTTPGGKFDSPAHEHAISIPLQGGRLIPHGSLEYDVPTMRNVSGEGTSTMLNHIFGGASPSSEFDGLAHGHGDIETGGSCVPFSDLTQQFPSRPRWTILGDSLLDVIVQAPSALVGFKTSNASSPAKDVLLRVLVIVYGVGFLCALGSKLFSSSKMGGIGSAAAILGFLLTMVLLLL